MVESGGRTTPNATVTVSPFRMYAVGKTFGNETPLHCEISVTIKRSAFVCAPAHRTVVYDDVLLIPAENGIRVFGFFVIDLLVS